MVVDCIGLSRLDFAPRDGSPVKGWQVYYTYKAVGVEGVAADKVFVSDDAIRQSGGKSPYCPSRINLDFDRKGKLISFKMAEK